VSSVKNGEPNQTTRRRSFPSDSHTVADYRMLTFTKLFSNTVGT
jgi:hypothetical protein